MDVYVGKPLSNDRVFIEIVVTNHLYESSEVNRTKTRATATDGRPLIH